MTAAEFLEWEPGDEIGRLLGDHLAGRKIDASVGVDPGLQRRHQDRLLALPLIANEVRRPKRPPDECVAKERAVGISPGRHDDEDDCEAV